jgi:hypothetical protein
VKATCRRASGWSAIGAERVLFPSAPADQVRADRLTRNVDTLEMPRARRTPNGGGGCGELS